MKHEEIKEIINNMTLEQKIGQCLTFGFAGSVPTSDLIDAIKKYHPGGLRLSPYSNNFEYKVKAETEYPYENDEDYVKCGDKQVPVSIGPYYSPSQYGKVLDDLQKLSQETNGGIPLHTSVDQEGALSHDICKGGITLFPCQMGLAAANDLDLVEKSGESIGRQLRNYGVNMIHSPVVDVNICRNNLEIDNRAFSDDAEFTADVAKAMVKGLQKEGCIATAKHFPGRGNSEVDAHDEIPVIEGSREEFFARDLLPYKKLIDAGLDSIMVAHTIYPGLDPSGTMSTISKTIITDILRGELGFDGVITTDSITMAAIVKKYGVPEASAMSLVAGVDLILMKEESKLRGEVFHTIKKYVEDGKLTEEMLDEKVYRLIRLKAERGLFKSAPAEETAAKCIPDQKAYDCSKAISAKSMMVTENEDNIIPLEKSKRIFLIDQIFFDRSPNDLWNHPRKFYELLEAKGFNITKREELSYLDHMMGGHNLEIDTKKITEKLAEDDFDVVIVSSNYYRNYKTDTDVIKQILEQSSKPVLVVTNTMYESAYVKEAKNCIINYNPTPSGYDALVDILDGSLKAEGVSPLKTVKPLG